MIFKISIFMYYKNDYDYLSTDKYAYNTLSNSQ